MLTLGERSLERTFAAALSSVIAIPATCAPSSGEIARTNEGVTSLSTGAGAPAALSTLMKWAICLRAARDTTLMPRP